MEKYVKATYPKNDGVGKFKNQTTIIKGATGEEFVKNLKGNYEIPWFFNGEISSDEGIYPSIGASFSVCVGLNFILDNKNSHRTECIKKTFDTMFNDQDNLIKNIMVDALNKAPQNTIDTVNNKLESEGMKTEFELIKGSIYKIKRYFMENNNIRDIRGGSWLVDYLNNEYIQEFLQNTDNGLIKECLIYSGGGNILLMAPKGKGEEVCNKLEEAFQKRGLSIMCAFTYIQVSVYNILYRYQEVMRILDRKLQSCTKSKINDLVPTEIKVSHIGNINLVEDIITQEKESCDLCHVRTGKYKIQEVEQKVACPSCYIKHKIGTNTREDFFRDYKAIVDRCKPHESTKLTDPQNAISIDEIGDRNNMIAVIYGDGNNMGAVVHSIKNIYEMMYFSYKTDCVTKESVYSAIYEVMKKDDHFEPLAVGGDDIFLVVPADYAPLLGEKIIEAFDTAFDKEITMSVGVCIGKSSTPIAAMFEVAHNNLDNAKVKAREQINNGKEAEGTIDITEIRGGQTVLNDKAYRGLFPLTVSQLSQAVKTTGEMKDSKLRLYDYDYAAKVMIPNEFNLYFEYKEAQAKGAKNRDKGMKEHLREIYEENINCLLQQKSPWADLILLIKYRRES